MDRLLRLARWFGAHPGAQLVAGACVLMIAFPATAAGTIGRLIACGAVGIGVAAWWPRAPAALRRPPRDLSLAIVLAIVVVTGVVAFWDTLTVSPDWQMGDWGPQHAVLARIMPSLPGLDVPVWNHALSTGDAPLELYPALTYLVTGHFALALGLGHDLPLAYMIFATLVHLALAVTTTVMVARVSSRPLALVFGLFWLVDSGAISHGGTVGLFHWALLHSAFAHVFSMISALGILAGLKRPRLGASVAIWLGTAVATAGHPAALITAATFAIALVAVALLASDVPPRRALAALGHLVLGVALGATVWLPSSERLLAYGQHFSNDLQSPVRLLELVMAVAMPMTVYSLFVYLGYLGILIGMWVRRAEVVFIAIVGCVMMIGLCDAPYLAFGLAPGRTVARLGAIRMMLLVRPFIFASAAFVVASMIEVARAAWVDAKPRARAIAAALLAVMAATVIRVIPSYWAAETTRAVAESQQFAPDPAGRAQLEAWAEQQMRDLGPDRWGRALFEEDTHEQMHLTAETGLPTFHLGAQPDLLLRDRIEDATPESLARFNVRWAIGIGRAPALGDPATERQLGTYYIREIAGWDGKFARIERGTGTVKVTRLDDHAVEIEVAASAPVLVALGTGFYPRWRARHASGADEPVYAYRATPNSTLHVVSAWVAPGKTTFTCDGPLPSDGDGRLISLVAALLALAAVIVWRRPRWRYRVLRAFVRLRERMPVAVWLTDYGIPALLAVLLVRGWVTTYGRTEAFQVGNGIRSSATVEAHALGSPWVTCSYSAIAGNYRCDDLVTVEDATVNLINDAAPSWAFITPSVFVLPDHEAVTVRISRPTRLSGQYAAAVTSGPAILDVGGDRRDLASRQMLLFPDAGERPTSLKLEVPSQGTHVTIVAVETLEPPRAYLVAPPESAPPAIEAIR